jgi:hypothetical protein
LSCYVGIGYEIWNLGYLIVFLSIHTVRFSKRLFFGQLKNQPPNLGH